MAQERAGHLGLVGAMGGMLTLGALLQAWDFWAGLGLSSVLLWGGAALLVASAVAGRAWGRFLGLGAPSLGALGAAALLGAAMAVVATALLNAVNAAYVRLGLTPPPAFPPVTAPATAVLGVVVLAPVAEELFFRGSLLSAYGRGRSGVIATAVLFGLAHLSLRSLVPLVLIGLVLGFLVRETGSVFPAIVAHSLANGLSLAMTIALERGALTEASAAGCVRLGLFPAVLVLAWGAMRGGALRAATGREWRAARAVLGDWPLATIYIMALIAFIMELSA